MDSVYIEHVADDRWEVKVWEDNGPRLLYYSSTKIGALAFAGLSAPDEIRIVERIEPVLSSGEIVRGLREILDGMEEIVG